MLEFAQRRCVQRRFLRPVGLRALQGLGYVSLFLRPLAATVLRVRALPVFYPRRSKINKPFKPFDGLPLAGLL